VLMALALLPTVKNTLSGVCLSFPVAGTTSIIKVVKDCAISDDCDRMEDKHEQKVRMR
jgi:hypothetical protein